jgi:tetratricopeptide (TPR) repeat protein
MKTIIQGYLQFSNSKSFEKAMNAFHNRTAVYYKNEFHFKTPEFFDLEKYRFVIPRSVVDLSDKYWRNTNDAVGFLSQFAVYGRVEAYQLDNGVVIRKKITEPKNDKQVSTDYHLAVDYINQNNSNQEHAKKLLLNVLESEPNHAQALEYLALIFIREKSYESALELLQKAAQPGIQSSRTHYLKGTAYLRMQEYEKAASDFEQAIKLSLAIQDTHWKSRLQKAKTLIELEVIDNAEKELNFYINRSFESGSENDMAKKDAFFYLGQIHYLKNDLKKSLDFIEKAIKYSSNDQHVSDAKCIYYRGVVSQKMGFDTYTKDFAKAKALGFVLAQS